MNSATSCRACAANGSTSCSPITGLITGWSVHALDFVSVLRINLVIIVVSLVTFLSRRLQSPRPSVGIAPPEAGLPQAPQLALRMLLYLFMFSARQAVTSSSSISDAPIQIVRHVRPLMDPLSPVRHLLHVQLAIALCVQPVSMPKLERVLGSSFVLLARGTNLTGAFRSCIGTGVFSCDAATGLTALAWLVNAVVFAIFLS